MVYETGGKTYSLVYANRNCSLCQPKNHGGGMDSFGYDIISFPSTKNPDLHGFKKKAELLRAGTTALTI